MPFSTDSFRPSSQKESSNFSAQNPNQIHQPIEQNELASQKLIFSEPKMLNLFSRIFKAIISNRYGNSFFNENLNEILKNKTDSIPYKKMMKEAYAFVLSNRLIEISNRIKNFSLQ